MKSVKGLFILMVCALVGFFAYDAKNRMPSTAKEINAKFPQAEKQIQALNRGLANQSFPRVNNLTKYLNYLYQKFPEHQSLAKEFLKETKPDSPIVLSYKKRLQFVKNNEQPSQATLAELDAIILGTKPEVFDHSFVDLLNTVADLTGYRLARSYLEKPTKTTWDPYKDGKGAHLVGNDNYGQWQGEGSAKTWVWNAALAGTALYAGYKFTQWSSRRGWSYFNDVGRGLFGSAKAKAGLSAYAVKQNSMFRPTALVSSLQNKSCAKVPAHLTSMCQANQKQFASNRYNASHRRSSRSRSRYGGK